MTGIWGPAASARWDTHFVQHEVLEGSAREPGGAADSDSDPGGPEELSLAGRGHPVLPAMAPGGGAGEGPARELSLCRPGPLASGDHRRPPVLLWRRPPEPSAGG